MEADAVTESQGHVLLSCVRQIQATPLASRASEVVSEHRPVSITDTRDQLS